MAFTSGYEAFLPLDASAKSGTVLLEGLTGTFGIRRYSSLRIA